jgi:hypothetical protein
MIRAIPFDHHTTEGLKRITNPMGTEILSGTLNTLRKNGTPAITKRLGSHQYAENAKSPEKNVSIRNLSGLNNSKASRPGLSKP